MSERWSQDSDLAARDILRCRTVSLPVLPLAAALLLLAVNRQQALESADWATFLDHGMSLALAASPLILAHLLAWRVSRPATLAFWAVAFALYPFAVGMLEGAWRLHGIEWFALAVASATSLFLEQRSPTNMLAPLRRLPLTLDGVMLVLLALWALAASSLFIATHDPVANQPLKVWFDGQRILDHPLLFASYLGQFGLMAGLVFGFYWLCRHVLVRRVLRQRGWISFCAGSLVLWLLYTPIACSIVLLLPLNTRDWSLIPSEVPNPFLSANYRFAIMVWVVICPVVLASERLLAQAREADNRHAQVRAELQLLRQQVNPHFLFNTLNTLYALCLSNNPASAQAIVKLSDLLRYSIYEVEGDWVPLDGEITHLRNYLDLQLLRFSNHCRVEANWPASTEGLCVPPQLLIMLVENMFKHGVERSQSQVAIRLDLSVEAGRMEFRCTNSPHDAAGDPIEPGLGLTNLRRRLELLCGQDFVLESGPAADRWRAKLVLDLRPC